MRTTASSRADPARNRATEVWWILADVINSVELAAGEDVRNEVRDYITNHYEED